MAFKTDQIKLKEDYSNDGDAGTPVDGTLALIGATGSKELKVRDNSAWVAISGGGGSLSNVVEDTTPQLGGDLDANGNNIDMGTNAITDAKVGEWDTAYGWGNHTSGGYLTSETSHADVLVDSDFGSAGLMTTDGAGNYSLTANNFLTSETSHADVVVDGDFTQNGIMTRTGAGAYSAITDNSSNWDTAYTWGDHSSEGYIDQDSDIVASLGVDYTVPDNVGHNIIAITGDPSTFEFIFTRSSLGNWSSSGQQKVEIINASSYSQTINGDGGGSPAMFYLINTATGSLGSITIDPYQKAIIIPNMSDNSGQHFVLLTSI
jgi:hypothetical protein